MFLHLLSFCSSMLDTLSSSVKLNKPCVFFVVFISAWLWIRLPRMAVHPPTSLRRPFVALPDTRSIKAGMAGNEM